MKKTVLVIVLVLMMAFVLSSCGVHGIVGTWRNSDGVVMVFENDGRGSAFFDNECFDFTYKPLKDKRLYITTDDPYYGEETEEYKYGIKTLEHEEADTLYLKGEIFGESISDETFVNQTSEGFVGIWENDDGYKLVVEDDSTGTMEYDGRITEFTYEASFPEVTVSYQTNNGDNRTINIDYYFSSDFFGVEFYLFIDGREFTRVVE